MNDAFASVPRSSRGVRLGLWVRRAVLCVLALVPLAGLLDLFGQTPQTHATRAPAASLRLSAPSTVRGGLFFQARVDVVAAAAIQNPRLVLDEGWFEGMQLNSAEPQPVSEAPRDGRVVLSYDTLDQGDRLRLWVQFEANPTGVGHRSFAIELDDGTRPLARLSPTITVLP